MSKSADGSQEDRSICHCSCSSSSFYINKAQPSCVKAIKGSQSTDSNQGQSPTDLMFSSSTGGLLIVVCYSEGPLALTLLTLSITY